MQVVLPSDRRRLAALPSPARESIMALAASFLPYYMPPPATLPALLRFPNPRALAGGGSGGAAAGREGGGSRAAAAAAAGEAQAAVRPHIEGAGADFVIGCVADTLSKDIRTEAGQLRYLATLSSLRGAPCMALLRATTKLRLQVRLLLCLLSVPQVYTAVEIWWAGKGGGAVECGTGARASGHVSVPR